MGATPLPSPSHPSIPPPPLRSRPPVIQLGVRWSTVSSPSGVWGDTDTLWAREINAGGHSISASCSGRSRILQGRCGGFYFPPSRSGFPSSLFLPLPPPFPPSHFHIFFISVANCSCINCKFTKCDEFASDCGCLGACFKVIVSFYVLVFQLLSCCVILLLINVIVLVVFLIVFL